MGFDHRQPFDVSAELASPLRRAHADPCPEVHPRRIASQECFRTHDQIGARRIRDQSAGFFQTARDIEGDRTSLYDGDLRNVHTFESESQVQRPLQVRLELPIDIECHVNAKLLRSYAYAVGERVESRRIPILGNHASRVGARHGR